MRTKYFESRNVPVKLDYDDVYLGPQRDPDGVVRDPYAERTRKLEDLAQEIAFVNSLPPGRILDVGCGLGFFLSGVVADWEKHGQEVSKPCTDYAAQFCNTFRGTLEEARYPDDHFDVVVSMSVVEHIPDPMPTMREMWRVLKPGGKLVLRTPNFDSGVARRFGERYRLLQTPGHVTLFSDTSLRAALHDIGFTVDRCEYPFFETRHFTMENFGRLFDTSKVSPAFYGNHMCFYATKPQTPGPVAWGRPLLAALDEWLGVNATAIEAAARAIVVAKGPKAEAMMPALAARAAELASAAGGGAGAGAPARLSAGRIDIPGTATLEPPGGEAGFDFALAALRAACAAVRV
ncbi:MAG: class I SAM-dependent methyltransferase [Rhodospirillales bacterium]|nr:class I SAM-dependent methyltransferase [Rhodospirillales bacterium]